MTHSGNHGQAGDEEPIDVEFLSDSTPARSSAGKPAQSAGITQIPFDVSASEDDLFAAVEFADNPEPRCPCVLVLDISGSMAGASIDQLNLALKHFVQEVSLDSLASKRLELAVVTCGGDVRVAHDFATVSHFVPPILMAGGDTPLGAAIEKAIELIDRRKRNYRLGGVSYFRPWLVVLTDGTPTDDIGQAARLLHQEEAGKSLVAFCFGTDTFDKVTMTRVFPRQPLTMRGARFQEFFRWLSASMASVSHSRPGDRLKLTKPADDWVID